MRASIASMIAYLVVTAVLAGCTTPPEPEEPQIDISAIQASESDRIPAAEEKFLADLKKAITDKDKEQVKVLFRLDNAAPMAVETIPYLLGEIAGLNLENTTIKIVPDNKAAQNRIKFTARYLGQVEFVTRTKTSGSTMRVGVGIVDGRYYLTVGAQ